MNPIYGLVAAALITFSCASFARPPQAASSPLAVADRAAVEPNEAQLKEHGHYVNRSHQVVHAPAHSATGAAPDGASAKCRDGTFSFSQHHRGTCSHHGGVGQWL